MNRGFSGTFSFKLFPPRVQNRYTGTGCYSFNKTSTAVHGRRKKQRTRNLEMFEWWQRQRPGRRWRGRCVAMKDTAATDRRRLLVISSVQCPHHAAVIVCGRRNI